MNSGEQRLSAGSVVRIIAAAAVGAAVPFVLFGMLLIADALFTLPEPSPAAWTAYAACAWVGSVSAGWAAGRRYADGAAQTLLHRGAAAFAILSALFVAFLAIYTNGDNHIWAAVAVVLCAASPLGMTLSGLAAGGSSSQV